MMPNEVAGEQNGGVAAALPFQRARVRVLCVLGLLLLSSGCGTFTVVGFAIGSSIERPHELPARTYPTPEQCEELRVQAEDADGGVREADVTLIAATPQVATLRTQDDAVVTSRWDRFTKVSCIDESYAGIGALVGLGVDVIATVLLVRAITSDLRLQTQ